MWEVCAEPDEDDPSSSPWQRQAWDTAGQACLGEQFDDLAELDAELNMVIDERDVAVREAAAAEAAAEEMEADGLERARPPLRLEPRCERLHALGTRRQA